MILATWSAVRQACAMKPAWIIAFVLAIAGSSTGCRSRLVAIVDGVLLPECDSLIEPPSAPTIAVRAEPAVPDDQLPFPPGQVRLAIDREVPWARVEALLATLQERKIEPILLVGQTYRVRRFVLNDVLSGAPTFTITGDTKGKFCVQTAQLPQAYCVQGSGIHIHRAFVRETVREVVKKWEMKEVDVYVDPAMHWADVVRIVDGARTCCGTTEVLVKVAADAPLGSDAESGNPAIRDLDAEAADAVEAAQAPGPARDAEPAPRPAAAAGAVPPVSTAPR
jgi:hypothetical protein